MKVLFFIALIALFALTQAWVGNKCHTKRVSAYKYVTHRTSYRKRIPYVKYITKTYRKTVCKKVRQSRKVKHWYKCTRKYCYNTNQKYWKTIVYYRTHLKTTKKTRKVKKSKQVKVVKRKKHRIKYRTWKLKRYRTTESCKCKKSVKKYYWHHYVQSYRTKCVVLRPKTVWKYEDRLVNQKYTDRVWTEKYQKVKKNCYKKVYIDVVKYKKVTKKVKVKKIIKVKKTISCVKSRKRKQRRFRYVTRIGTCRRTVFKYKKHRVTAYKSVWRNHISYKTKYYFAPETYNHVQRTRKRHTRRELRTRRVKKCKNIPTRRYRWKVVYYYKTLPRLVSYRKRVKTVAHKWVKKYRLNRRRVKYFKNKRFCERVTDTLKNKCLFAGYALYSSNKAYKFIMQRDGNAVVYKRGHVVWSTHTHGKGGVKICIQSDGGLILYGRNNKRVWSARTHVIGRRSTFRLIMQNDGNLVTYNRYNQPIWASRGGRLKHWKRK